MLQLRECGFIDAAGAMSQTVACPVFQLFDRPAGFGYADDRDIQVSFPDHRLQRGEKILVGQISGSSEKYQGVGERYILRRVFWEEGGRRDGVHWQVPFYFDAAQGMKRSFSVRQ